MADGDLPERPSGLWLTSSAITTGLVGALSRTFLIAFSKLTVHGLDKFEQLLKEREDVADRKRGLITGIP